MFASEFPGHVRVNGLKRPIALLVATAATVIALAAMPAAGGDSPLESVMPQRAEAFQGGWDRDHWWIKVTRGEVVGGLVTGICLRYVRLPVAGSYVCRSVGSLANRMIGGSQGFWAEIYRTGAVRAGTW